MALKLLKKLHDKRDMVAAKADRLARAL